MARRAIRSRALGAAAFPPPSPLLAHPLPPCAPFPHAPPSLARPHPSRVPSLARSPPSLAPRPVYRAALGSRVPSRQHPPPRLIESARASCSSARGMAERSRAGRAACGRAPGGSHARDHREGDPARGMGWGRGGETRRKARQRGGGAQAVGKSPMAHCVAYASSPRPQPRLEGENGGEGGLFGPALLAVAQPARPPHHPPFVE
ncbi:hypothetical protein K523DRAFT_358721 [Schizophyllum commune Tattone D]|nr:hypothetical protein K523DRAFT_358721 [Schizophyllum commune Tattone D]